MFHGVGKHMWNICESATLIYTSTVEPFRLKDPVTYLLAAIAEAPLNIGENTSKLGQSTSDNN